MNWRTLALAISVLIFTNSTSAQTMTKSRCESLRDEIEHYSSLRRKGGSASQMERWKQERKKLEEKYKEGGCKKYGRAFW